jgi:uncharacterized membrane protein YphA (DoxX/SURF4 family)
MIQSFPFRFFRNFLEVSLVALALHIFMVTGNGCSDRPEDFQNLRYILGIAFVAAFGITYLESKKPQIVTTFHYAVLWFVRYYLAYVLIGYGTAKLIDLQFHGGLANLDQKLGDITPMGLDWAFFGASYPYGCFVGIAQIIAALLLFNRRTSTFAAVLMLGVLSNVVMVNLAYDVCVKLFSSIYLVMNLYILSYDFPRFWAFFFQTKPVLPAVNRDFWPKSFSPKGIVIFNALLAVLMVAQQANRIVGYVISPERQKPLTYGAWEIERVQVGTFVDQIKPDPVRWRRMFFEEGNQVSINSETGFVAGFNAKYDAYNQLVELRSSEDSNQVWTGKYVFDADKNTMIFEGLNGSDSIKINLKRIGHYQR